MANEPQSPIRALAELLAEQPTLKANQVPVFAWRKSQSKTTLPPRIVIYPTKAPLISATSKPEAIWDVEQHMNATCWGADGEQAWAVMVWLIQALESQAVGTDVDANDPSSGPGYAYDVLGADWEVDPDGTKGEAVSLLFSVRLSIAALPENVGHMGTWPTGQVDRATQDYPESREVNNG